MCTLRSGHLFKLLLPIVMDIFARLITALLGKKLETGIPSELRNERNVENIIRMSAMTQQSTLI